MSGNSNSGRARVSPEQRALRQAWGARLRAVRLARDWTMQELGEELRRACRADGLRLHYPVAASTVGAWEAGRGRMPQAVRAWVEAQEQQAGGQKP